MSWSVEFRPAAARSLRKLSRDALVRIRKSLDELAQDPRPSGAKRLVGGNGLLRIRVGDYRVVHEVHDHVLVIVVVALGHRREIYRRGR
ncbi:MAG: type II toxin-antitoxin system RelE/ParE family toxin [Nocardiopsaceae bacterium]|nr:type II toxin-antitoxin system RelE/ParE family toxin [Nocardiopsaceae bacterium]